MVKNNDLGTYPVGKLLVRLALPSIVAQLINMLYNMVDRIYIGHIAGIGNLALTGVGVCFPLILLISAFAALVSMGGAPRASIAMGRGNKDEANDIMGNCVTMLLIVSVTLTIFFLLFAKKLLLAFGASENTIGYAEEYMRIYSFGTIFVQMTLGLNAFISAQGFSKTSMNTVLIGAVANIILDPIFIFVLDLGVKGAALATVISQALSTVWTIRFLTSEKSELRIAKSRLRLNKKVALPCLALGLAPFIMQSTESLLSVCYNSSLLKYGGDLAVGSMTIINSISSMAMLPLYGMTQGAQPVISFNYGAGNRERMKKAFFLTLAACTSFSFLIWLAVMVRPQFFISLFTTDAALSEATRHACRIFFAMYLILGIQISCQQSFVALGNAKNALILALLRKIILLIPLIYILPHFISSATDAVFLAEPVADTIAVTTTAIMFAVSFRKTLKNMPKQEIPTEVGTIAEQ